MGKSHGMEAEIEEGLRFWQHVPQKDRKKKKRKKSKEKEKLYFLTSVSGRLPVSAEAQMAHGDYEVY